MFRGLVLLSLLIGAPSVRTAPAPPPRKPDLEQHLYSCLRDGRPFEHPDLNIRVKEVRNRMLLGLVIERKARDGKVDIRLKAQQGEVRVGKDGKSLLIHLHNGEGHSNDGSRAVFEDRHLEVTLTAPLHRRSK